jgi:hypothetical protein
VEGTLDLFDEFRDIVERKPGLEVAKVANLKRQGFLAADWPTRKPAAERLVDDIAKRSPRLARLNLEPVSDVFVKGQGRSHAALVLCP